MSFNKGVLRKVIKSRYFRRDETSTPGWVLELECGHSCARDGSAKKVWNNAKCYSCGRVEKVLKVKDSVSLSFCSQDAPDGDYNPSHIDKKICIVSWSLSGRGFGELVLEQKDDKLYMNTECLDKATVMKIFEMLYDQAIKD